MIVVQLSCFYCNSKTIPDSRPYLSPITPSTILHAFTQAFLDGIYNLYCLSTFTEACAMFCSTQTTGLDLDGEGGCTFLRVLLHLVMANHPALVSGSLQLLFRHFNQRQEVLQAFTQVELHAYIIFTHLYINRVTLGAAWQHLLPGAEFHSPLSMFLYLFVLEQFKLDVTTFCSMKQLFSRFPPKSLPRRVGRETFKFHS